VTVNILAGIVPNFTKAAKPGPGFAGAVKQVPVGRGEGLEQAVAWINSQPGSRWATISPYYRSVTNPYLWGESLGFSEIGKSQVLADYVVFYITQTQRQLPFPGLVEHFQKQTPAYVVKHGDTPYVWIYKRKLPVIKLEGEAEIIGRAWIAGYSLTPIDPDPGDEVDFVLYLMTADQALPENEDFRVSLVGPDGTAYGDWTSSPTLFMDDWQINAVFRNPALNRQPIEFIGG